MNTSKDDLCCFIQMLSTCITKCQLKVIGTVKLEQIAVFLYCLCRLGCEPYTWAEFSTLAEIHPDSKVRFTQLCGILQKFQADIYQVTLSYIFLLA